jgi:hypothetical protein
MDLGPNLQSAGTSWRTLFRVALAVLAATGMPEGQAIAALAGRAAASHPPSAQAALCAFPLRRFVADCAVGPFRASSAVDDRIAE